MSGRRRSDHFYFRHITLTPFFFWLISAQQIQIKIKFLSRLFFFNRRRYLYFLYFHSFASTTMAENIDLVTHNVTNESPDESMKMFYAKITHTNTVNLRRHSCRILCVWSRSHKSLTATPNQVVWRRRLNIKSFLNVTDTFLGALNIFSMKMLNSFKLFTDDVISLRNFFCLVLLLSLSDLVSTIYFWFRWYRMNDGGFSRSNRISVAITIVFKYYTHFIAHSTNEFQI